MTRRTFLTSGAAAAAAQQPQRPNILLILADQFRYDCLGANGNRLIRTPNLDRLAGRSTNFASAFVQAPVCVPSRVSLLTGRYPHSHKNRVNYTPCDPSEVFLQRMLHDAGYQTGSVGKLHFTPPTAEHARSTGFDRVLLDDSNNKLEQYSDYTRWRQQHDPQAAIPYNRTAPKDGNPYRGAIPYEYTLTHWTGEQSCRMLRDLSQTDRPFFLHCSFFKPHAPYTVPEPYDTMFDQVEIPLPKQVTLQYIRSLPAPVQRMVLRTPDEYQIDRKLLQWIYRSYYASIAMVDYEIGRILDELDRSGRAGNTIVIFSTDHGDQLLEHGLTGKNVFFEASVHVPLLVHAPGRLTQGRRTELTEMIDVMPSILEWCGVNVPPRVQGRPFAAREMVVSENIIPEVITGGKNNYAFEPGKGIKDVRHPDSKMLRTDRWKLNYYPGNGGELYDLRNDPGEERNLYGHAAHQSTVRDLKAALLDWMITADENDQIAPKWLI